METLKRTDYEAISRIAKRAVSLFPGADKLTIEMDLEAAHKSVGIDFDKLENFDDFNFMHDIVGIDKNINRNSGELGNCFLPRSAR